MYFAYLQNRSKKDPSVGWYNGELWFFDNYVIPLANKLKECGVFGVSGDEYLGYAVQNRNEWKAKGHASVEAMKQCAVAKAKKMGLIHKDITDDIEVASATMESIVEEGTEGSTPPEFEAVNLVISAGLEAGQRIVTAPPGKLGFAVEGQVVYEVDSGSPLEGKLKAGDLIIAIDGVATQAMSPEDIATLILANEHQQRQFIVQG
jgi:PDZ domain-containing secreted protein